MNNLVSNFIGFDGRLNRQPFWISAIVLGVVVMIITLVLLPVLGLSVMPNLPPLGGDTSTADIAAALGAAQSRGAWISIVLFLVFLYPGAALAIKRRHDRNSSGLDVWIYYGLSLITLVLTALGVGMTPTDFGNGVVMNMPGPIITGLNLIMGVYAIYLLVVLGFLKGTAGPNNYGPDPLQG